MRRSMVFPLLLLVLQVLGAGCGRGGGAPKVAPRGAVLQRQVEGLEALVASFSGGNFLRFDGVLVTLDEKLVGELLESATPYERVIDDKYRIVVQSARVRFREGFALVELAGRGSLADREESDVYGDVRVFGALEVVGLDPESGVLRARVNVIGFEVPQIGVMGLSAPVRRVVEQLASQPLEKFNVLASNLEIPVAVEPEIQIPAIDEKEVLIEAARVPLRVAVQDVRVAGGKLWVSVGVDVKAEGAPPEADTTAPEQEAAEQALRGEPPASLRLAASGMPGLATLLPVVEQGGGDAHAAGVPKQTGAQEPSRDSAPAQRGEPQDSDPQSDGAAPVPAGSEVPRRADDWDPAQPDSADTPEMTELRERYAVLRDSLRALALKDSLLVSMASDTGDVAVGIRPELVDRLLKEAGHRFLDKVELRLDLEEKVTEGEDVRVKALVAKVNAGRWQLNVTIHRVHGVFSAREPSLSVVGENRLRLTIPVRLESGSGNATVRFSWDAKGVTGAACGDFTRQLTVDGTVIPRDYQVVGDLVLTAEGERVIARPEFEKQKVRISVSPSRETWGKVRSTLAGLDSFGKCGIGMQFMSSDKIVKLVDGLVTKGFNVTLPTKIVPTLELPAGLTEEVEVEGQRVRIVASPNVLRATRQALWYSAGVDVGLEPVPREAAAATGATTS